jgi:hypothetical protein
MWVWGMKEIIDEICEETTKEPVRLQTTTIANLWNIPLKTSIDIHKNTNIKKLSNKHRHLRNFICK